MIHLRRLVPSLLIPLAQAATIVSLFSNRLINIPDTSSSSALPQPHYFVQTLDHFNAHNAGTWKQRYFVNDTFWTNPYDGPVFFMIEGEGAASAYWAVKGHHMDMAKEIGALVFVVEHRYYGGSVPVANFSTENLHLSSQQTLADLAVFIEFVVKKYKLDIGENGRNKIIAFGGSYSGALAAWVRIKYPHLIYASVTSSAPIFAQLDFSEYNQVVAESMATPEVGGSEECAKAIYTGFKEIDQYLDTNTTESLLC